MRRKEIMAMLYLMDSPVMCTFVLKLTTLTERERENKQRPLRVPHKAPYVCRGDSVMVAPHSIPQCTVCLCQVLFMSFSFMRLSTNSHRYSIYL